MLKKPILFLSVWAILLFAFPKISFSADSEAIRIAKALSDAYAEIAASVTPSVVAIETEKAMDDEEMGELPPNIPPQFRDFLRQYRQQRPAPRAQGMGSGIIIDKTGLILTNSHVVEGAGKMKVTLQDGKEYDAEEVGVDPKTDLAIIRLKDIKDKELPVAKLGDSDKVKVGNLVMAIGAPFGLKQTVTCGIVSATNRNRLGGGELRDVMYQDFIQTDATINPGNSGGPLVNLDGEVIGINSAITTASMGSDGVGFSIPINMAREIKDELINSGSVTRGYLGVEIQDFSSQMRKAMPEIESGVVVRRIFPGTPAAEGGMQFGDIMLTYNGTKLEDAAHLQNLVAHTPIGQVAKVVVMRGGEKVPLDITIAKQPKKMLAGKAPAEEEPEKVAEPAQKYGSEAMGMQVVPLSEGTEEEKEMYKDDAGVLVFNVTPGGVAENAGIAKGDLIMLINQKQIGGIEDFKKAEQELKDKKAALVHFNSSGAQNVATLELDGKK